MRESFKQVVTAYNDHIRESSSDLSKEGRRITAQKTDSLTEDAALVRRNQKETQEKIFGLQNEKHTLMQKLHKWFRAIETKRNIELGPGVRLVTQEDNQLYFIEKNGEKSPINRAEILSDGDWGIQYGFDTSVDTRLQKEYILTDTKRKIQKKLNEQIMLDEIESRSTGEGVKKAYQEVYKKRDTPERQSGLLAEKMIKGLLSQYAHNGAPFSIVDADIYQDVTQKIDFIVKVKTHTRGIEAQSDEKTVGIQFTLNPNKQEKKLEQLQSAKAYTKGVVDDMMLVVLPLSDIQSIYDTWQEKKTPGGPEGLWDTNTKQKILQGILQNLVSEDEIKAIITQ